MGDQPLNQCSALVTSQIVHDQQQSQGWQDGAQRGLDSEAGLPVSPGGAVGCRWQQWGWWQDVQNQKQWLFEPGVQHRIRAIPYTFDSHCAGAGMEQREQFGGTVSQVLVRITSRA